MRVKEEKEEEEEEGTAAGPSGTGEEPDTLIDEGDLLRRAYEDYESGGYSPKLLKFADVEEVCGFVSLRIIQQHPTPHLPLTTPIVPHCSPSPIGPTGRCYG